VTEWFGAPKTKARIAELSGSLDAPFESGSLLLTPLSEASDARLTQLVAVHQLTHAAFPSSRLWIYEGLAHFAQAAYREQQGGRQAALEFLQSHAVGLPEAEKDAAGKKDASESLVNTSSEDFYRSKAMYVWWMLREMIGDAQLQAVLKNYHPEQDKDPTYIQQLVSAQNKRDLEWFFDDWVYRDRGLPDFKIVSAAPRETLAGQFVVAITVENTGGAGAEVPLNLRTLTGEKGTKLTVRAKQKEITRISVPGTPIEATVNDGSVPESDTTNNSFKFPQ